MTTDHIDLETLSAFADGDLNAVHALRVERHVAECGECRRSLERVRTLVASAKALPREVAPPAELWAAIRRQVPSNQATKNQERRWWYNGWLAAAAGLVLVVGTASLTLIASANKAKASRSVASTGARVPVVLAAVEQNYAPTLAELRATLETQRRLLAPSTIRTLENTLAVIDSAIAEARTALEADPNSGALVDLLSLSYQRKVEFLRRATTLSSSL